MVTKHFLELTRVAKIPATPEWLTGTALAHDSLESTPDRYGCKTENLVRDTIQAIPGRYGDDYEPPGTQNTMYFVHAELIGRQVFEHTKANNMIETG